MTPREKAHAVLWAQQLLADGYQPAQVVRRTGLDLAEVEKQLRVSQALWQVPAYGGPRPATE